MAGCYYVVKKDDKTGGTVLHHTSLDSTFNHTKSVYNDICCFTGSKRKD